MLVIFVHGWSVTDTSTYGRLPEALARRAARSGLDLRVEHVWLGRYISFHDEVTVADIAHAFDRALRDLPGRRAIPEFSCITHSTGGPVVREWLDRFYGRRKLAGCPMRHLVMLAPANHGSALAALGKSRVGRIHSWFQGVEPGQRVLDWLSLGSQGQIDLATANLDDDPVRDGVFPFVLTGQTIDKKLYDFLNSYLTEAGSDGVVRVAAANMNYSMIRLVETTRSANVDHGRESLAVRMLEVDGELQRPKPTALGVIPGASHSGTDKGIMGSVKTETTRKPQVDEILKCLQVRTQSDYQRRSRQLATLTKSSQPGHRYLMLVFVVKDDSGDPVTDFDLFLLGGDLASPGGLSKGFFVDRQCNAKHKNHLVYYIDYDVIIRKKLTGFRVIARPAEGFTFFRAVEYRSKDRLNRVLQPNETFYVEIELRRCVDKNVFRLDGLEEHDLRKTGALWWKGVSRHSFEDEEPSGEPIDE